MKIIKFTGGLGNQMFQYAFYKSCEKYDPRTFADITQYESQNFHTGFELEKVFNIQLRLAEKKQINKYGYPTSSFSRFKRKFLPTKESYVREKYIGYDSSVSELRDKNVYLVGFWQSYKYFCKVEKQLQEDFTCSCKLSNTTRSLIESLDDNAIAVHIRRTDFLTKRNSHFINLCENDYYTKAMDYFKGRVSKPRFLFFSDDLEWVKNNFSLNNSVLIDWNTGSESYQDMIIMSCCKNIIIANSTFSWWGAWLNPYDIKKHVVCPRKWYNVSKVNGLTIKPEDIIYPNWIAI